MEHQPSALSPFRHHIFRAVWFASLASNFGSLIESVGAAWLMTSLGASAAMIALVQASTTLPIMLFSLAAGAIADNFDRRELMLTAQVFLLVVSIGLTLCAYLGLVTPWLLLLFTFLIGCGTALNGPAWQSLVGEMVPRSDLPGAIVLNSMGYNIARSVGPAIGGAIVAAAGAFGAFAVNAVSYVGLIAVLARWRPETPPRVLPPESLGTAMAAGLRYVAMSPSISLVLVRGALFGLAAIAVQALMPLIARDLVHGGPLTFGLLLGAFGAGAVCGALLAARLRRSLSIEAIVRVGFIGFAVCVIGAGLSSSAVLTMVAMVFGGASWVVSLSSFNVTVQLSAPRWVVGRALALYQMATFGGMACGSWIWGMLAERYGVSEALWIAGGVLIAGAAFGLRYALPELKSLNLDPLSRWKEPAVALDIRPRSGPIVVTIEYLIREQDVAAFLAVMAQRRRVRRRDGARHWTLLRDLENPKLWLERYHTPTWLEYVRHNQRRTQADAAIGERLLALHQGPEEPRVHRMIERPTGWLTPDAASSVRDTAGPLADTAGPS
ncbi:MFS transporter [Microvirga lotononidis]|uniref:Arabinose efflux permease family protein n=1 Tax=Microvirga lotononidis TaxID=864069 RepID=I4YS10_9HYPH|nr:MFS transporter [Microvirga lotononidis]EIM26752.1 arabinose efflux permease family protein [Microvirga lotononidis]WQO31663.1 MFS transporter [Microvirga lotononidis]